MIYTSNNLCKNCAECCKNYPFVRLSKSEINWIAVFTQLHIDAFADSIATVTGEYFLKFADNGDCCFLDENNGTYSCSVYETRPEICINYPSTASQKKFCSKHLPPTWQA
jgi:Fe-S-cluster containining protein